MPDMITERRHDLQECAALCRASHQACIETMMHCLDRGGAHAARDHIRLLADCADICRTAGDFMLRASPLHGAVCAVCAEICDQCAAECDSFADADTVMEICASTCRRCAESCAVMASV